MTAACIYTKVFCDMRRRSDSSIYSNKIQISEFTTKTALEDLRIRFSVYGSIKDCYFISHSGSNRLAYIIFYQTYSAMMATLDKNHIYLHDKKLTVWGELVNKEASKFDLKIVPGNTLHINELNNDCILHIFEFLSIMERFKLKSVCTRWCTIANESLRTIRHFDLEIRDLVIFENIDQKKQFMKLLRNLADRNLRTETYSSLYKTHTASKVIASLNMYLLALDCRDLTKLIIKCATYDENILSRILTVNKQLKHIEILLNPYITGESLIHLSENIHTLIVNSCQSLQSNHLCAALKRLKNLKRLTLEHNRCNVVQIMNEYCQNLEILEWNFTDKYRHFYEIYNPVDFNIFLPITNLRHLRELKMNVYGPVTETFLVNLSQNCQELRRLKLFPLTSNNWRISDAGMNAIISLTKLEELILQYRVMNLANLHGLQKIRIQDCDVEEEQVVSVIRNSPELRYLCIYGCNNVTENIFSEVRAISARRCNNIMLELVTRWRPSPMRKCVIYNDKIY